MPPSDKKGALDETHVTSRIFQITFALIAVIISIVSVVDSDRYSGGDPNGYLMMASIMCWVDTAALGAIGLLAFFKPQDLAWYMVLIFDVLAMLASIAAPICINCNQQDWKRRHLFLRFVANFGWLNLFPIGISILRTAQKAWREEKASRLRDWWQGQQARRAHPKRQSDMWTPEEIRKLEKRVEQLETEARSRSYTPSETIARWTSYSGEGTLPDYQSQPETIPI